MYIELRLATSKQWSGEDVFITLERKSSVIAFDSYSGFCYTFYQGFMPTISVEWYFRLEFVQVLL